MGRLAGDVDHVATVRVQVAKEIAEPPEGIVLQLRLDPRLRIRRVTFQGADLHPCRTDGYQVDAGANYLAVRAALRRRLVVGDNDLRVEYDAPFVPHAD